MLDLAFQVESAEPQRSAAAPTLGFRLRIAQNARAPVPIQSVLLRCQIRIEAARRRYGPAEQQRLLDLFGTPERWGQTLRDLVWTQLSVLVGPFAGSTTVDLAVPCSFDFTLATTKYFHALAGGEIPLSFLFSGTVFHEAPEGGLQVAQIPWDSEAHYLLPAWTWKDLIDLYYPNSAWLCLRRDVFDLLQQHKVRRGIPTWEETLEELLAAAQEAISP